MVDSEAVKTAYVSLGAPKVPYRTAVEWQMRGMYAEGDVVRRYPNLKTGTSGMTPLFSAVVTVVNPGTNRLDSPRWPWMTSC